MRWLVTGASRGIGRALLDVLVARGDQVIAGVRDAESVSDLVGVRGVSVAVMDVTRPESVRAARRACPFASLDVVVSNAAISGGKQHAPGMDLEHAASVLVTNALGPLHVYDAFVDLLRAAANEALSADSADSARVAPRLVHVSSEAGSLSHFRASSKPEYAMSKASLNALTRWVAAVEPALVCTSVDPGWTQTSLGGGGAPFAAAETAKRLVAAIDRLRPEHSGGFVDTDLAALPW